MTILPSYIIIPARTAADLRFVGEGLSARDVAWTLGVLWWAARHPSIDPDGDWWRIPDNRMRQAIGLTRRSRVDVEVGRFERLAASSIRVGELQYPMPHPVYRLSFGGEKIWDRNNLDDEVSWVINPNLVKAFTRVGEEPVVYLPLQLIQRARQLHTAEVVLRMLAWKALGHEREFARGGDHIGVHLTQNETIYEFGLPVSLKPSRLMLDYLGPISEEVSRIARLHLEFAPVYAKTMRNPRGKLKWFDAFMSVPPETDVEAYARMYVEEKAERRKAWRKPVLGPKRKEPRPPPADVTNVTALRSVKSDANARNFRATLSRPVQVQGPQVGVDPDADLPF